MLKKSFLAASLIAALSPTVKADVFISEYIEGSSNNKAIELVNSGSTSVDLSGYQLKMYFNGSTTAGNTISLSGSLAANATFVIANSNAHADILAVTDLQNSGSWFNGDDAVVLENDGVVIDSIGQLGVDPGSSWTSNGVATANNTIRRLPGITSGDLNPADEFVVDQQWLAFGNDNFSDLGVAGNVTETPPPVVESCGDNATLISSIQGLTDVSPMVGQTVSVEAVVVGDFQNSDQLKGFFLQEETTDMDADNNTSEGIFVYYNGVDVNEGDRVRVAGSVQEYYNNTQLGSVTSLEVCASSVINSITPVQVALPVANATDWEAVENMKVSFAQNLSVAEVYNLGRYGELSIASERLYIPTQMVTPGAEALAKKAENNLKRIILDDGSTKQNPAVIPYPAPGLSASNTVRVGDTIMNLEGVLTYSYSNFRIHPTSTPDFAQTNTREEVPTLPNSGSLRVASFNVLNYFNGDGQGAGFPTSRGANTSVEFDKQKTKIVNAILAMNADIIGLMEIENDGFDSLSAIADLTSGLNAAAPAGTSYAFVKSGLGLAGIDPVGSDEITVGLLYRTETVSESGSVAVFADVAFSDKNRLPLAQTFKEVSSGKEITVAVNHFKSKGSSCDAIIVNGVADVDQNDGQGNCNLTRLAAANSLADWLATHPTGVEEDDVLIIGDLNSYNQEDPVKAIIAKGFTNLSENLNGNEAYSYVFSGESGSLDHALASASLTEKVTAIIDWHINSDEPKVLDYNEEYQTPQQIIDWYAPDVFRASDHDPVIIEINTSAIPPTTPSSYRNDKDVVIKDYKTVKSKIKVDGNGDSAEIAVHVDIKHSYVGDLKLVLVAPNGQKFVLRKYEGGDADNILESYILDATGIERNGKWKLKVYDAYQYDTGYINSWSIDFK